MKSREGRWAAAEGNETEAPEAAGDCQVGFARPGCEVAGIKELAGQPAPQSWAEGSERRRATPRAQLYKSSQTETPEEPGPLCWRPSSLMGKDVWPLQLGYRNDSENGSFKPGWRVGEGERERERKRDPQTPSVL